MKENAHRKRMELHVAALNAIHMANDLKDLVCVPNLARNQKARIRAWRELEQYARQQAIASGDTPAEPAVCSTDPELPLDQTGS